jgi:Fibrobacter succinogenes major domain (Fib_succ_major).
MKKLPLFFCCLVFALIAQSQQTVKRNTTSNTSSSPVKFGALAIDRSNGFYYGWSADQPSLGAAEQRALEECNKRGGNCSVVLTYSGTGCAVYRTIDGKVGTAFGWAVAKTKEAADALATSECLKRSNGQPATNYVWSCNSSGTAPLKEIYNATNEISAVVKIGNQWWMDRNLNSRTFRNGDTIFLARNDDEWAAATKAGKPACRYWKDNKENGAKLGLLYNWAAVIDPRGLAPKGFRIPTKEDWLKLINYTGDGSNTQAAKNLKSKSGFKEYNGNDRFGFNALPNCIAGSYGGFNGADGVYIWSSTADKGKYVYAFSIFTLEKFGCEIISYAKTAGLAVRCLKN